MAMFFLDAFFPSYFGIDLLLLSLPCRYSDDVFLGKPTGTCEKFGPQRATLLAGTTHWLVVGFYPEKFSGVNVSWDDFPFPTEWEVIIQPCSKPPTSHL